MLPARLSSVCSVLFLLTLARTTGDIVNYKKFTRDLKSILGNGGPIIAVAFIKNKPILRTYVPNNIPRMAPPNNQDVHNELLQETDSTLRPKTVDLQMAYQDTGVIGKGTDEFEGIQLTPKQKRMLRKKWRSTCDKQAAKTCRKACIAAQKLACNQYHCKSAIKRSLKKNCKSSCTEFFLGSRSDKSDDVFSD